METREWRLVASTALILVGCLVLAAALGARWVDTVLLDTDTFVAALGPLARDEGVQSATASRVSAAIIERADLAARAGEILPQNLLPLAEQLIGSFEGSVEDSVDTFIRSDLFADAWAESLRIWHASFAEAVKGGAAEYLDFEEGGMRVALAPYLEVVESRIESPILRPVVGLAADQLRDSRVTIVESRAFGRQIEVLRWLYDMRTVLWWVAAIALTLGILLAPRRALGVTLAGLGVVLASAAPAVWLVTQRLNAQSLMGRLLGATPEASGALYDTLAAPLLGWLLTTLGVGLVAAATGWVAGRTLLPRSAPTDSG
jgi:hypothetical protein